ncbi:MAG: hypothetical protein ACE5I1_13330 [bacterium]
MSRIIESIRKVVRQEITQQRSSLFGVVTAVFPHETADDENNYEVNIRLKHEDLELRRVPLSVGHIGLAAPPREGDLVLVQFVDGDINQPVILERFYHADDRPPLHKADEILFEHRVPDDTLNHLRFANDGSIFLQREVTKPEDNSEAKTSIKIDGASGDLEVKAGESIVIILKNDSEIQILADGKPNKIKCQKKTVEGDLEITDGATKTTITGSTIQGG